ncbi:MAG: Asp-tRNA(Asn)/Glu-tRNA(Gln) amidotransferase subunit GatC [bacterium]
MKIDINHIAHLARIKLTDNEREKFSEDLEGILNYVSELQEVDVSQILPMTGGTDVVNAFRHFDEISDFASQEIVAQFPEKEEGFLKVPKIFE